MKNYYELLEINENASQEVIERIYKLFAKKYHPDVNPDNKEEAEEKFKEITEAYEVLSDESKRKAYDEKLNAERQRQSQTQSSNNNTNTSSQSTASSSSRQTYSNTSTTSQRPHNSSSSSLADNINMYNQMINENFERIQTARENEIKRAYNDAYVEALKSMGVKVVYKKTFKDNVRSGVRILLFIVIIAIVALILWQIPDFRNSILELISSFPINF